MRPAVATLTVFPVGAPIPCSLVQRTYDTWRVFSNPALSLGLIEGSVLAHGSFLLLALCCWWCCCCQVLDNKKAHMPRCWWCIPWLDPDGMISPGACTQHFLPQTLPFPPPTYGPQHHLTMNGHGPSRAEFTSNTKIIFGVPPGKLSMRFSCMPGDQDKQNNSLRCLMRPTAFYWSINSN